MNWETALLDSLPALRRYALFLSRNTHDADDLVNDCVVRVLASKTAFDQSRSFRPWAFQILRNLFIDGRRKTASKPHLDIEGMVALPDDAMQDAQHNTLEAKQTLAALYALPDQSRDVLVLVAIEGFSYKECAVCLDIPVGTVMSRVARARKQLTEALQRAPARLNQDGETR